MASHIIATIATLVLVFNSAYALKCYSCDSSKGVTCGYGLLSFTYNTVDCSQMNSGSGFLDTLASVIPSTCAKFVGKDASGNEFIGRGCAPSTGPINSCRALAKVIQFADKEEIENLDCYTCDTDNCNSATKIGGLTLIGLITACILFLF